MCPRPAGYQGSVSLLVDGGGGWFPILRRLPADEHQVHGADRPLEEDPTLGHRPAARGVHHEGVRRPL